jgi:hypothetical protein
MVLSIDTRSIGSSQIPMLIFVDRALGYRLPTARFANDVDVLSMLVVGGFDRGNVRYCSVPFFSHFGRDRY